MRKINITFDIKLKQQLKHLILEWKKVFHLSIAPTLHPRLEF